MYKHTLYRTNTHKQTRKHTCMHSWKRILLLSHTLAYTLSLALSRIHAQHANTHVHTHTQHTSKQAKPCWFCCSRHVLFLPSGEYSATSFLLLSALCHVAWASKKPTCGGYMCDVCCHQGIIRRCVSSSFERQKLTHFDYRDKNQNFFRVEK